MNYGLTFSAHDETKKETNLKRDWECPRRVFVWRAAQEEPLKFYPESYQRVLNFQTFMKDCLKAIFDSRLHKSGWLIIISLSQSHIALHLFVVGFPKSRVYRINFTKIVHTQVVLSDTSQWRQSKIASDVLTPMTSRIIQKEGRQKNENAIKVEIINYLYLLSTDGCPTDIYHRFIFILDRYR